MADKELALGTIFTGKLSPSFQKSINQLKSTLAGVNSASQKAKKGVAAYGLATEKAAKQTKKAASDTKKLGQETAYITRCGPDN